MKFHEKLERLVAEQDTSQSRLSRQTGIAQSAISELVSGKRKPRLDQAFQLARALGVSLDYLADDELDEQPDHLTDDERRIVDITRRLAQSRGYVFEDFTERLHIERLGYNIPKEAPPTEQGRPKGNASGGPKPRA